MSVFEQSINIVGNEAIRILDPIAVYNNYRVCHAHLTEDDNYTNNRLEKDAVPTVNLPAPRICALSEQIMGSSRPVSRILHYVDVTRESHLLPRAKRLYRIASRLSRSNRRLKSRRLFRHARVSNREVLNEALDNLNSGVANFIRSQIALAGRKAQSRRYNLEEKLMGLILYKQSGKGSEEHFRPPSLINWTITIKGIIDVFEMLERGNVNVLKCRWLNQDPIENFFGQIRQQGVRDTNPSCSHFKNNFKTLLINNFSSRHSVPANCEDDETKNVIVAVKKFITQDVVPVSTDLGTFSVEIPQQAMTYISKVSGFMTRYVKKYISTCHGCKQGIFSEHPVDEWHALISAKEHLGRMPAKLKYCHPNIIKFSQIYNVMYVLPQLAYRNNSLQLVLNFVLNNVSLPLNRHNPRNSLNATLIDKFIQFICHNWTAGINRTLSLKELRTTNNDPVIK
nr:unnamed protein product [Callosobruchus analis]